MGFRRKGAFLPPNKNRTITLPNHYTVYQIPIESIRIHNQDALHVGIEFFATIFLRNCLLAEVNWQNQYQATVQNSIKILNSLGQLIQIRQLNKHSVSEKFLKNARY